MTKEVRSYLNASLRGHLSLARGEKESLSEQHEGEGTQSQENKVQFFVQEN